MKSAAVVVCTLLLVSTLVSAAPSYADYESECTNFIFYIIYYNGDFILCCLRATPHPHDGLYSSYKRTAWTIWVR